jgi:hypothetical protein
MLNMQPTREVLRPENQLELSEKELDEEIAKMLTANNPAAPKNIARYDQKLRTFKFEPMVDMNMVRAALHTHSNDILYPLPSGCRVPSIRQAVDCA